MIATNSGASVELIQKEGGKSWYERSKDKENGKDLEDMENKTKTLNYSEYDYRTNKQNQGTVKIKEKHQTRI